MNSLTRGLTILETLVHKGADMGISELARAVQADKSTVFRLLGILSESGYVMQDTETRKYRPTSKLLVLGSAVLSRIDLRETARPFLTNLVERTRLTAHLAALVEGRWREVVYLDQASRVSAAVMVNIRVGRVAPSHSSSTGKAILAFLPEEQRALIEGELPRYTPKTITSGAALRLQLEAVRALGYAVDDEETREGLRCIAAPIRNHNGVVVASLGLSGPTADLKLEDVPELARLVVQQADELSRALGYSPANSAAGPGLTVAPWIPVTS